MVPAHTVRRLVTMLDSQRKEFDGIVRRFRRNEDCSVANAEMDLWEDRVCATLTEFGADEAAVKLRKSKGTTIAGEFEENLERRIEAKETVLVAILNDLNDHSDFWKRKLEEKTLAAKGGNGKVAVSASGSGTEKPTQRERVAMICSRLHLVARQLRVRHDGRSTLEIRDEYDVQDLLHALLRIDFEDVRTEEWTASYAGGSARMDFLLKTEQIVIEAKIARKGHVAKQISDELIIDVARYREHRDCRSLVCLVYDPDDHIGNPRGVENDLRKLSDSQLQVTVIVVP
jgi:REase_DpnII-MboI